MQHYNSVLDILVCPICKGKLRYNASHQELVCFFDKRAYPITHNIPVMLVEKSRLLTDKELARNREY